MNQRIFAAILLVLVATSAAALELTVTPTSLFLPSGGTETISVTVTNNDAESIDLVSFVHADTPITVDLSALPALPITLLPGDDATFTIDVTSGSAGNYVVTFEAEANTSATTLGSLEVTVPAETGFSTGDALEAGDEDQEREETVTGTFTLENMQNSAISGISVSDTVPDRYELVLSGVPSSMAAFATATLTYELTIPIDQDSGRERIGTITFTANEASDALDVFLTTESGLRLEDLDVDSDSDSDRNLRDGDEIDYEFSPGERVTFTIEIENTLDYDFDEVEIEMLIEDIDDGDEIEEESDRLDIRDGDSEVFEITFTIPNDAEEDTYEVIFTIIGEDEEGALHETIATIDLVVELERDDLAVTRFTATPTSVCPGESIAFNVDVANRGSRDQDDARIIVEIENLDLAEARDFSIERAGDRDDEYDTTITLRVPSDADAGTYSARALAYYDTNKILDAALLTITVEACGANGDGDSGTDGGSDSGSGVIVIEPITPSPQPPAPSEPSSDGVRDDVYFWLLVALNVLVIFIVIAFIIRLLMK